MRLLGVCFVVWLCLWLCLFGDAILVMVLVVYLGRCMVYVEIENCLPLYVILWTCVYALKMVDLSLALLGLL